MNISITTDYAGATGAPEPALRRIAGAGFTHIHWCHHFNDDFVYGGYEVDEIKSVVKKLGLRLLDVHGSCGREKRYWSLREYERLEGVELVKNRIELFRALDGEGCVIMHIPYLTADISPEAAEMRQREFSSVLRSLDELVPYMETRGVRLALENMPDDTWETLDACFARYPEKTVGLCYDSGHGNWRIRKQIADIARGDRRRRLMALHLNDNGGAADDHQPPFMGTVEWNQLLPVIAGSPYRGPLSFEIVMRQTPFVDPAAMEQPEERQVAFLTDAFRRCSGMAEQYGKDFSRHET